MLGCSLSIPLCSYWGKPARGLSHCGDTEASARDVVTTDQPSLSCGKVLNIHMVWERSLLCNNTGFSSP